MRAAEHDMPVGRRLNPVVPAARDEQRRVCIFVVDGRQIKDVPVIECRVQASTKAPTSGGGRGSRGSVCSKPADSFDVVDKRGAGLDGERDARVAPIAANNSRQVHQQRPSRGRHHDNMLDAASDGEVRVDGTALVLVNVAANARRAAAHNDLIIRRDRVRTWACMRLVTHERINE